MSTSNLVECPKCGRNWEYDTEQAANISLIGGCIACHVKYGHDIHKDIQDVAKSRRKEI